MERAKHSFLLCPIPLSCLVINKICLNQDLEIKSYDEAFPSDLVKFLRFLIAGETGITDSEKTIDIVCSIGQV